MFHSNRLLFPAVYLLVPMITVWAIGQANFASAQTWSRHAIDDSLRGADGVRLGDFDRDGFIDVVTGWEESGVIRLYRNPGPTHATEPWPAVTIGKADSPEDAVPFDIDGDGKLEVISCHEGKTRRVYIHRHSAGSLIDPNNWSSEPWTQVDGQMWMFAAPIELAPIELGHPRQALVIGSKGNSGSITLLIPAKTGATDLSAWTVVKLRDAGWIMSLMAIDMDRDGDEDLVFSDRKGANRGVGWLEQPADPRIDLWTEHSIGASKYEPMFVDASYDRVLVATRDSVLLDFHRSANEDWNPIQIANPPRVRYGKAVKRLSDNAMVLTSNTDADKQANPKQPGIWIRQGDNPWQVIEATTGVKLDRIECIDLDGDGDLDVMTCEERKNLGVIWYQNPG